MFCGKPECRGLLAKIVSLGLVPEGGTQERLMVPAMFSKKRTAEGDLYEEADSRRKRRMRNQRTIRHVSLSRGKWTPGAEDGWARDTLTLDELPVQVKCPNCGWISELGLELLNAS